MAAAACEDNQEHYRDLVQLEARSTFGFQGARWLADVMPDLLDESLNQAIQLSKIAAKVRVDAESTIPKQLLYTKGWPTVMPTLNEANHLAEVRRKVANAVGFDIEYTSGASILERYAMLMDESPARADQTVLH